MYKQRMDIFPEVMKGVNNAIGAISKQFVEECRLKDLSKFEERFDKLITLNQGLLQAAGMSTPTIDLFIAKLASLKVSAKITGAGGGGCVLVNAGNGENDDRIEALSVEMGMVVYKVEMGVPGVALVE